MGRRVAIVPLLAVVLSGCALVTARVPRAASLPFAPISCSYYSLRGVLTGCSHVAETGGVARFVELYGGNYPSPPPPPDRPSIRVVFARHHGSIDISLRQGPRTHPNQCPRGREYTMQGKVFAAHGAVSKAVRRGEPVLAFVCYAPSRKLLPGTRFVL